MELPALDDGVGSPEEWDRIEVALGYTGVDPQRRKQLARMIGNAYRAYFSPGMGEVAEIRDINYRNAFRLLNETATKLRAYLSPASDLSLVESLDELDRRALHIVSFELPRAKREALIECLSELIYQTTLPDWAYTAPTKRGRPKNWQRDAFIYSLAAIYKTETRKAAGISYDRRRRKHYGPFFTFVKTAIAMFAPRQATNDAALAKAIQRALRPPEEE
jgi:hypothetical protein